MKYTKHYSTRQAPQSQPIPGSDQAQNSAGGFSWVVDDWKRLERFLILGSEGGTYYATEQKLTVENAEAVKCCIEADGKRAVDTIVLISEEARAPKNDPALFALAIAFAFGDTETRQYAVAALPAVARIGTHLYSFCEALQSLAPIQGRLMRRALGAWFNEKDPDRLAYQFVKYRQRNGWTFGDVLRLAHPRPVDKAHGSLYAWVLGKTEAWAPGGTEKWDKTLWAFEEAQRTTTPKQWVHLIQDYGLPREALPTEALNSIEVWEALLYTPMPMTAMIRNLGVMTSKELIAPLSKAEKFVRERLQDAGALQYARIHPIQALAALVTYKQGHGTRGKLSWSPSQPVLDALDSAFYATFGNVRATGKNTLLALDVSGSMGMGCVTGIPGLTPRIASAAMALITANAEPNHAFMAFSHNIVPFGVSPRMRLDAVAKQMMMMPFGGTDCALPMIWAYQNRINVDVFIVYTDGETWYGNVHPAQALREYRRRTGIAAKLTVVGMVSNGFTIADPNDAGMLDVVGFDTATPNILTDFAND